MSRSRRNVRRLTGKRLAITLLASGTITLLLLAVLPLIGFDITSGARHLAWLDVSDVWAGMTGHDTDASRLFVIARLPRALAAAVVGAGLAAAGCAFQAVLRNPLAEPYTLGIASGSSLGAVIAIRFGLEATLLGGSAVGLSALAGAAITVYFVWRLGQVSGSLPPATMLLAGITIAMFCSAATMLLQYTADFTQVNRIVHWLMGGLDAVDTSSLLRTAVVIGVGCVALLLLSRDFNALSAGEDAAASVGVNAKRSTIVAFAAASLIVGAAISVAGPIGFIGLIVPHALRGLVGPDHRVLLPVSMLAGATMLLVCDTVARLILFPNQIPVGIVTALIGGPFFLGLLLREKGRGRLWGG